MVFVASIIRHKLCMIYAFFDFFSKMIFDQKIYSEMNLTTLGSLYICLVLSDLFTEIANFGAIRDFDYCKYKLSREQLLYCEQWGRCIDNHSRTQLYIVAHFLFWILKYLGSNGKSLMLELLRNTFLSILYLVEREFLCKPECGARAKTWSTCVRLHLLIFPYLKSNTL